MDHDQRHHWGRAQPGPLRQGEVSRISGRSFDPNFLFPYMSGFALPVAIVAKCEEKIFLAPKKFIWRKQVAKKNSPKKKIGILISPIWAILCHLIAN